MVRLLTRERMRENISPEITSNFYPRLCASLEEDRIRREW